MARFVRGLSGSRPRSVPSSGTTEVTVIGSGFAQSPWISCVFAPGTQEATGPLDGSDTLRIGGRWVSQEEVSCPTWPVVRLMGTSGTTGQSSAVVRLAVSNNGAEVHGSWVDLNVSDAPVLERVVPASGPTSGRTWLSLYGRGFLDSSELSCSFGHRRTPAVFISTTRASCRSPPLAGDARIAFPPDGTRDTAETVRLRVSNNGLDDSTSDLYFHYVPHFKITGMYPRIVSLEDVSMGNAVVAVSGMRPAPDLDDRVYASSNFTCRFEGLGTAAATVLGQAAIECLVPAMEASAGPVLVTVSMNGYDFPSAGHGTVLSLAPAPQAMSLFPDMGPFAGGTCVEVRGVHLSVSSALSCTFSFHDGTELVVPAAAEAQELSSCISPPVPSSVLETANASEEGSIVRASVALAFADRMHINATLVGPDPTPSVDFLYYPSPIIKALAPTKGPPGTSIEISGEGFLEGDGLRCRFGAHAVQPVSVNGTGRMSCVVPQLPEVEGFVSLPLEASNNLMDWTSSGHSFTYRPRVVIEGISPKMGPLSGSTVVRLVGSRLLSPGGDGHTELWCRFGSTGVPVATVSEDAVICPSPPADKPGPVDVIIVDNGVDVTGRAARFDYVEEVEITGAAPLSGPEAGGTVVRFSGRSLLGMGPVVCEFGSPRFRVAARRLERKGFSCETPAQKPGAARLRISSNGQQYSDTGLSFVYRPQETVTSFSPRRGSVTGGTVVAVNGTGFVNTTSLVCLIGERFGEAVFKNTTLVLCRVPQADVMDGVSLVTVRVANNGVDFTDPGELFFRYVPFFDIESIEPRSGPITGGTALRVYGKGLSTAGELSCVIDGIMAAAVAECSEVVRCVTPAVSHARRRTVQVELTTNGVDMSYSSVSFLYYPPVQVHSVYPTSAPEDGGSKLLVSGSGFLEGAALSCFFALAGRRGTGSRVRTAASFVSKTLLSCQSPQGRVGDATLHVSNNGADLSTSWTSVTITGASTVTSIWPRAGSALGGTPVRVLGTGFVDSPTTFCRFGDQVVTPDFVVDYTVLLCASPPSRDLGDVPVSVSINGIDWTSTSVRFKYLAPISISGVSPLVGPMEGGTLVRISGSGFDSNGASLSCRLGPTVVSAAIVDADIAALCVAPPSMSQESVPVELSSNGVDFVSGGWVFRYAPATMATSAWPRSGPESGGTIVVVRGTGFIDSGHVTCEFGSPASRVLAEWHDETTVHCSSPPHMPGEESLRVSINGQQFVDTGLTFEYHARSSVRRLEPSLGTRGGGTVVEVTGTAFVNSTSLSCRIAAQRVPATFVSAELVKCITPSSSSLAAWPLEVSNNGLDFTSDGVLFSFVPALEVHGIWPTAGPTSGGTSVMVSGSGFSSGTNLRCLIGGRQREAVAHTDQELACSTPPALTPGLVRFQVTNNGVDMVEALPGFVYSAPIVLTEVEPATSQEGGGGEVLVTGRNFIDSSSLACRFGAQDPSPARFLTATRLSCVVPPSSAGPRQVSLAVSNNGRDFAAGELAFSYLPSFTLLKLHPGAGPVGGGTTVTVVGAGLDGVGPWACVFGESSVVAARQSPEGSLRCRSPPHPPGRAALRVFKSPSPLASAVSGAIASAHSDSLQDFGLIFLYQGTVYVSSVQPRSGSALGGTPLTLRGFGFADASSPTCGFGQGPGGLMTSPAVHASDSMLVCRSPPRPLGETRWAAEPVGPSVVSVMVSLNGVDFTPSGPQFVYHEPLAVAGVFPQQGSVHGGTVVTVVGRNFLPSEGVSCRFGAFEPSSAEFIASDAIRCTAPPSPHGPLEVEVAVSNNLVEFSESSATFTYVPEIRSQGFRPAAGPLSGGTVVSIEASGFTSASRPSCKFGGLAVSAILDSTSATQIRCQAPPSSSERTVPLEISINGVDWENAGAFAGRGFYTYYRPPALDDIQPPTGSLAGGTRVSILGRRLTPVSDRPVLCRFGRDVAPATDEPRKRVWGSTGPEGGEEVVTCEAPRSDADGAMTVDVALSVDGGFYFSSPSLLFTYLEVSSENVVE